MLQNRCNNFSYFIFYWCLYIIENGLIRVRHLGFQGLAFQGLTVQGMIVDPQIQIENQLSHRNLVLNQALLLILIIKQHKKSQKMDDQDFDNFTQENDEESYYYIDYNQNYAIEISVNFHDDYDEGQNDSYEQQSNHQHESQNEIQFSQIQAQSDDQNHSQQQYLSQRQDEFHQSDEEQSQPHFSYQTRSNIQDSNSQSNHFEIFYRLNSQPQHNFTAENFSYSLVIGRNAPPRPPPIVFQSRGLTKNQIEQFPQMLWLKTHNKINFGQQCSCCLQTYKINEQLRVVPCMHRFHSDCIDKWFQNNATCPLCKKNFKEINA